ncbi:MAG: NADPH-dependent F420 reductase [Gemmatimonadota bacterium]|jgi:predicted dinucleotide-binding enzyme
MKIGIIGAGNIGGTLTRRFRQLGHDVYVANSRGPETLKDLAKETGATPVTVRDAARSGEVVVVTIPERAIADLPEDLFDGVADDVAVVDTGNYYPRQRDGRIEAIEDGMTESGWVSSRLGRPVVKAFNNIRAQHLMENGRPKDDPDRIALPVAGDDEAAKKVVMGLIDDLGFDPIDAGRLDESWRQQPGTPVYVANLDADGVRRGLKEAEPERTPAFTGTVESPGTFTEPE